MSENDYIPCPYCGSWVLKHGLYEHIQSCPSLLVKRSVVVPGKPEYREGEVPEPVKSVILSKLPLLSEVELE